MDWLTALIMDKVGGGLEAVSETLAVLFCLDVLLLAWCALLTIAAARRKRG